MKDAAKKFKKTCSKCNKPFSTANEEETLCKACRLKEEIEHLKENPPSPEKPFDPDEVVETRTCNVCGEEFVVTAKERDYLRSRGYALPTRCPECRAIYRTFANEGLKNIGYEATCVSCGAPIRMTNLSLFYFAARELKLPKHCRKCSAEIRERFKAKNNEDVAVAKDEEITEDAPISAVTTEEVIAASEAHVSKSVVDDVANVASDSVSGADSAEA